MTTNFGQASRSLAAFIVICCACGDDDNDRLHVVMQLVVLQHDIVVLHGY